MVVGGGSTGSRGSGEVSASCSADGSGTEFSVSIELLRTGAELCRHTGVGDTGCREDVEGFGCSSSSPSTDSTARSLPFLL